MKLTAIEAMKRVAATSFKFGDVSFNGFNDIKKVEVETKTKENGMVEDDQGANIDAWAELSIKYEGEPPQSYRVLNSMIMDWVDDNEAKLKKIINPQLKSYLQKEYPDIDLSDLEEDFDDYIWEDQVDYMPEINESKKKIDFVLELVLEVDEVEEEADA